MTTRFLVPLIACLMMGVLPTASAQPRASAALDALGVQAAREGEVRVIIGLNVQTVPEGQLTSKAIANQRDKVKRAQIKVTSTALGGGGSQVLANFKILPHMVATVDANAFARLRASPEVASIEADEAVPATLLESTDQVGATDAWSRGVTGAGKTVAVLDTGVDKNHPMLKGKVVSEACYSSNYTGVSSLCPNQVTASTDSGSGLHCASASAGCNHGTHVAGIVAGNGGSAGTLGVAPDAKLIAIQVFSYFDAYATVMSYTSDQIRGLERVYELRNTYDIAAVNMSLGGGRYYSTCDSGRTAFKAAVDNLRSVGIPTVIASGNSGYTDSIAAPACVSTAISVGAVCDKGPDSSSCATGKGNVTSYSNIASFVSLVAPGSYIRSSIPGGSYQSYSGTSMAAPHVAGAWALLKQVDPTVSVTAALSTLRANADVISDTRPGGTVTGLRSLKVNFLSNVERVLNVSLAGSGTGLVSSQPSGILCGGDCEEKFTTDATLTLTATPASNAAFTGWMGACTGTGPCTVTMTQSQSVSAVFSLKESSSTGGNPLWQRSRRPSRTSASQFATQGDRLVYRYATITNRTQSDLATNARCSTTGGCAK